MSEALDTLRALHGDFARAIGPDEAGWLGGLRASALQAAVDQGLPTRRLEAWKGTSLAALEKLRFGRVGPEDRTPTVVRGDGPPRLRFIDGQLTDASTGTSQLPDGVRLLSLAEARRQSPELLEGRLGQLADPKRHALVALQTAFLDDGAVMVLDAGCVLDAPVQLTFESSQGGPQAVAAFPRLLVIAGEGSRATLEILHRPASAAAGDAPDSGDASQVGVFTAFVAELFLAESARVEVVETQQEGSGHIHHTNLHARLEADARLESFVFSLGHGLNRSELCATLAEPGAEARLRGFYLGRERAHVDHFTTVDHTAPHCTSDQEYRGVLDGRSEGVFRGRVIVRPGAQKTDARQSNPNLLLSPHARIDSKPQLEIYADDIKASHGSTVGQLDPDSLFYLRARGLDEPTARVLLTRAFAHRIVEAIDAEPVREALRQRVDAELERVAQTGRGSGVER